MSTISAKMTDHRELAQKVDSIGLLIGRLGLFVTIFWIGATKFTVAEATGIEPLISRSPFFGWLLDLVDIRGLSAGIGVIEVVTAVLILLGLVNDYLGLVGGILAIGTFLVTISFLFTSTDYAHTIPFLSPGGTFIVKDIVLLGVSILVVAHSWIRIVAKNSSEKA